MLSTLIDFVSETCVLIAPSCKHCNVWISQLVNASKSAIEGPHSLLKTDNELMRTSRATSSAVPMFTLHRHERYSFEVISRCASWFCIDRKLFGP